MYIYLKPFSSVSFTPPYQTGTMISGIFSQHEVNLMLLVLDLMLPRFVHRLLVVYLVVALICFPQWCNFCFSNALDTIPDYLGISFVIIVAMHAQWANP